jgi:hypothetical protein
MTIREPQHAFPVWAGEVLAANLEGFGKYPFGKCRLECTFCQLQSGSLA